MRMLAIQADRIGKNVRNLTNWSFFLIFIENKTPKAEMKFTITKTTRDTEQNQSKLLDRKWFLVVDENWNTKFPFSSSTE